MEFRGLTKKSFRKSLEKRQFYDHVFFETEETKETITKWIYCLWDSKGIELHRFADLFCNWDEVVFPIRVVNCVMQKNMTAIEIWKNGFEGKDARINVIDAEEKKFYIDIVMSLPNINKFFIGRRDNNIDRKIEYKIIPPSKMNLQSFLIVKIDKNGMNQENKYFINYSSEEVEVRKIDTSKDSKVAIKYKAKDIERDEKVINLLSRTQVNLDNVLSLFFELIEILKNKGDIISIKTTVNGNIHSEIVINDGMVLKYLYTEYLSYKDEVCIHRISQPLDLQTFISKYKYYV